MLHLMVRTGQAQRRKNLDTKKPLRHVAQGSGRLFHLFQSGFQNPNIRLRYCRFAAEFFDSV